MKVKKIFILANVDQQRRSLITNLLESNQLNLAQMLDIITNNSNVILNNDNDIAINQANNISSELSNEGFIKKKITLVNSLVKSKYGNYKRRKSHIKQE